MMIQQTSTKRGAVSPLLVTSSRVRAVRGEGSYLWSEDGERYLDLTSGIGVTATGHCHPRVVEAVRRQAGELIHGQYTTVRHPLLDALSERLGSVMPGPIDRFFYASAGTEAVEAAMRLSRHATGRPNIVVFHGGFHGRTAGSLAMTTSSVKLRAGLQPLMGGVVVAPFPHAFRYGWDIDTATDFCLRELDHILATISAPGEAAAMFIEPVQGEGGYVPAPARFLQGLRERCDRHGMLLVLDEVQAGFGRTGRFWGHEHAGVVPDVVITAKGLASGFPLSAFGAREELMIRGWPGSQGGTYGGNAVSCAAALATLDVIEAEGLVQRAAEMGRYLRARLEEIAASHPAVADVRGAGLMLGTEIAGPEGAPDGARALAILGELEARRVICLRCGPQGQVVRWLPALIVSREQIDVALDAFVAALEATA
jgi:acetylornithine aminotransferase/4-aminobutyrate aminotransferase